MKFKKLITILTVSTMVLSNSVWFYAEERPKDSEVQQEYSDREARMEQEKLRIEMEILEKIENNPVTLSEREVNPMGLPDIDPVTNPASDNCLTRELVYQLGLGIGINNISELTQDDFNKLKGLDIRNNELTEIPKEIGNLYNLQSVFLDNNKLTKLRAEFFNLTNLQYLSLSNNQLIEVPKEIGNLTNLQSLWLDTNQLTEIPAEIGNLTNLQSLNLYTNQLTEIPAEIGNLTNLQYFYLDDNQLTELPNELSNLTNVKYFLLNDQNVKLDNKYIQPSKEFTIQNPISAFGNPIEPTNISNNGVYNPADNTITWLASDENREETFSFSQAVTIGSATKEFAGTVTLPTIIVEE